MVMLVLLVLGTVTLLVSALSKAVMQTERDKITVDALAKAKEALIGYAITYGDNNANQVYGYLPLPDLGTSHTTSNEGDAAGNFVGNTKNLSVIGRLPWRKLGLPPLRDGNGECLWYAVSGSFQNMQKADVLNWDSIGHFDTYSSNGTSAGTISTSGANYNQRPVAIIFAAGPLLPGQNRQPSASDIVDICGGNYDARNYLDSYNPDANTNSIVSYFSGTSNNSTGYAYNLNNASNGSQLSTTDLAAPKNIIFGDIESNTAGVINKISNDKILTISTDDIFNPITRRSDFAAQITVLMTDANFKPHLQSVPITGAKGTSSLNCNNTINALNKNFCNNWKEMLLLTQLPTVTSITIDGMPTPPCNRVAIFGGTKTNIQVRLTSADKDTPGNYIGGTNLSAFATPTANSNNFTGVSAFNASNPTADIMWCLP
jgi:hypothetical protein